MPANPMNFQALVNAAKTLPEPHLPVENIWLTHPRVILIHELSPDYRYYHRPWFYMADPSWGFYNYLAGYQAGKNDQQGNNGLGLLAILAIIATVMATIISASYALKRLVMSFHNLFSGHKAGAAAIRILSILGMGVLLGFAGAMIGTALGLSSPALGIVAGFWLGLSAGGALGSAFMGWVSQKFTRASHGTPARDQSRGDLRQATIDKLLDLNYRQFYDHTDIEVANAILIGQMNRETASDYKKSRAYQAREALKMGNGQPAKQYLSDLLRAQHDTSATFYDENIGLMHSYLFAFCQRNACLPENMPQAGWQCTFDRYEDQPPVYSVAVQFSVKDDKAPSHDQPPSYDDVDYPTHRM